MPEDEGRTDESSRSGDVSAAASELIQREGKGIFLESLAGEGSAEGYVLSSQLGDQWERIEKAIQSDIQRLRAHATANVPEQVARGLRLTAQDVEDRLSHTRVLVSYVRADLEAIEDHFGSAVDSLDESDQQAAEGQEPKSSD